MDITNDFLSGATALTMLGYIGYQLKAVPMQIWKQIRKRFVYTMHIDQKNRLMHLFEEWLAINYNKKYRNVEATMNKNMDGVKFSQYSDIFIIRYKGKRLIIEKNREKIEGGGSGWGEINPYFSSFSIQGWMAKKYIISLLGDVVAHYNSTARELKFFTSSSAGGWREGKPLRGKEIQNIFIQGKNEIVSDLNEFINAENWYRSKGLNYRRGYLLYGPPGTGKTSLSVALAKYFSKNIYLLKLGDMVDDGALDECISQMENNSILVIEDIDVSSGNRDEKKSKASMSGLLNCLDGIVSGYGIITIITTNHIDKLDGALLREGRIDLKLHVDYPNSKQIYEYIELFYECKLSNDGILNENITGVSMAKVQEICLRNKNNIDEAILQINKELSYEKDNNQKNSR